MIRALHEVERNVEVARQDFVARFRFLGRIGHQQRSRIAAAGHTAGTGIDAVVADDAVVIRVAQRIADVDQCVARADLRVRQAACIYGVAFRDPFVLVTRRQHIAG